MAETKKVLILKKCRIDGQKKRPGDVVEVAAGLANYLVGGLRKGTFELSRAEAVKKEYLESLKTKKAQKPEKPVPDK